MLRLVVMICAFLLTCSNGKDDQLERNFFKQPRVERVARMRSYSLEDQYKLFRYGNDKIEPPQLELANPIAERGASAIPFLTDQLKSSTDDFAVRDILWILLTMMRFRTYDVRQDPTLMSVLQTRILAMKNAEWQALSRRDLEEIKNAP